MSTALLLAALATAAPDGQLNYDARLALGYGQRINDPTEEIAGEFGVLFRYRFHRSGLAPTVLVEGSYLGFFRESRRDDLGVLGIGYGWSTDEIVLGLVPGIVVGEVHEEVGARGELGGGLRLMATAEFTHFVGVQAAYVATFHDSGLHHRVYASVSLNFVGLAAFWVISHR